MVTFSLDVSSQSMTKADDHSWGDNTDDDTANDYQETVGDTFENRIITSDLKVIAYKEDGTYVSELPILLSTETDGTVQFRFAFDAKVTGDATNPPTYRFMVLANCLDKDYGISYSDDAPDLSKLMFSMPLQDAIPMWGVKTFKFTYTDGVLNETQNLGTVSMLRAVAKIGVGLSDELKEEGYSIASLQLRYANTSGYSVPNGWDDVENTEALTHVGSFRNNLLSQNLNLWGYGEETGTQYMYVPETLNEEASELAIAVTLARTDENGSIVEILDFPYDKGIKFREYASGKPTGEKFNIVRNHYYDYLITDARVGTELTLTCEAQPWDYISENIDFSNNVTIESGNEIQWTEGYSSVDTGEYQVVLKNNGTCAVCRFLISTPAGAEWYASIVSESGVYGAFEFEGESSGFVGEEAELRIKVTDTTPQVISTAKLRIVVRTADGNTILVKTLVNAAGDEYTLIQNV